MGLASSRMNSLSLPLRLLFWLSLLLGGSVECLEVTVDRDPDANSGGYVELICSTDLREGDVESCLWQRPSDRNTFGAYSSGNSRRRDTDGYRGV